MEKQYSDLTPAQRDQVAERFMEALPEDQFIYELSDDGTVLSWRRIGYLARQCGKVLTLQVLESVAGFYIGTYDDMGPYSRESVEYWPTRERAMRALSSDAFKQRLTP